MYELMPLKNLSKLPPHLTIEEFRKILDAVDEYNSQFKTNSEKIKYRTERDKLFLQLLWESGGRVADICDLKVYDFDFDNSLLKLRVKKTQKVIPITLQQRILVKISEYLRKYKVHDELFGFTRVNGWYLVKKYSKHAGIKGIHPHKFRHGLAVHLLNQEVPLPVISARLGHSSTRTTMDMYLKVTPQIQRNFLDKVKLS